MQKFTSILFSLFVLFGLAANAQSNRCATVEHEAVLKAKDPEYEKRRIEVENFTAKVIEKKKMDPYAKMGGVVTIPVVFHVVYKTTGQNIPDERLYEQIEMLNQDFRRLNADTSDTPDAFTDVAADCDIEFCLAQVDPDGAPSTGITRTETDVTTFSFDDDVKFDATGGKDAWPRDTYLNFWVCNLGASLLGYAQFPGGPASTDGVVIHFNHVGDNPAGYPYHLGRTATHEIGHWLNLYHIWGDDGGCGGSDEVADTENQKFETYGCPSFPKTDDCSPDAPGIMFMNYMDYTDDACMNMFTEGQKIRMQSLFEPGGFRFSMLSAEVCALQAFDAQAIDAVPAGNVCETSVTPVITIRNGGSEILTSVDIVYAIDGGATSTLPWTGSLETGETENITLPVLPATEGDHTIEITLENPNGNPDGDVTDNTIETNFTVSLTGLALPMVQGFEDDDFPYAGYQLNNPDGYYTWEQTDDAAAIGTYSVFMNHFENNANGEIDEFTLPAYDFTSYETALLTFDVAYALYTASGIYSDTLEVLVSDDCGDTWTSLYKKYNPDLQTAPVHTSSFEPEDDEWRTESINLDAYTGFEQVYVKFRTISDYENNLYVDNINISDEEPQSVNDTDLFSGLSIYPTPAENWINIEFTTTLNGEVDLQLFDITGKYVHAENVMMHAGMNTNTLSIADLAPGMYGIQITGSGQSATMTFVKL